MQFNSILIINIVIISKKNILIIQFITKDFKKKYKNINLFCILIILIVYL